MNARDREGAARRQIPHRAGMPVSPEEGRQRRRNGTHPYKGCAVPAAAPGMRNRSPGWQGPACGHAAAVVLIRVEGWGMLCGDCWRRWVAGNMDWPAPGVPQEVTP